MSKTKTRAEIQVELDQAKKRIADLESMSASEGGERFTNEEKYRGIFDGSVVAIYVFDREKHFVDSNQAGLDLLGYSREELLKMSIPDVDADPVVVLPAHAELLSGGRLVNYEHKLRRKDNSVITVLNNSIPLTDSSGYVTGMLSTLHDITERKRAEEKLRASEERFRSLYENATIGMYRTTPDGQILLSNPALVRMLGYSSVEEMAQRNLGLEGYEHGYDRDIFLQQIEREGSIVGLESAWKRKDGATIFVRESAKTIRDADGKIMYYEGTVEDITARKQAEEKLRESEARYQQFISLTLEAISRTEFDHPVDTSLPVEEQIDLIYENAYLAECNQAMAGIYRSTVEDFVGTRLIDAHHGKDHPLNREAFRKFIAGGYQSTNTETREFTLDGKPIWVLNNTVGVVQDGKLVRLWETALDITEAKRAEEEIRHRNEDLFLINALNDAANRGETLSGIVEIFVNEIRNIFSCQDMAVYLLSPDGKYVEMQSATLSRKLIERIEQLIGQPLPRVRIPIRDGSYFQKSLMNEQGMLTADPQVIQQWIMEFTETTSLPAIIRPFVQKLVPQIQKIVNIRSMILMPLFSSGKIIGLMDISSRGQFTEEDLNRLRSISRQMTAVILRKQAEEQVQTHLKRLNGLNKIDRAINSSLDMRISLDILLNEVLSQLGVDAASVLLLDPSNQTLEYIAGRGFFEMSIHQSRIRVGEGLAGRVGMECKMLRLSDLGEAGFLFLRSDLLKGERFVEYIGVPLIAKGALKGVLEIFHRSPLSVDEEWMEYLETLGGQAAIAVDNVQLFDAMQKSNTELVIAYDATIAGWSQAMDLRDKETEGHTQRVTELTVRLAGAMGMSQEGIVHLRRGALLHDIGKLGVPDHILLKPGRLTDEEWIIMRQHPVYALNMLMPINYLRPALDIPYNHHEKWDGTGYPRGLKGEQIPLAARLFAIVDVWDAMRSDRPYRASVSVEEVRAYILAQSGRHFDPQVVEAFLGLLDELGDR